MFEFTKKFAVDDRLAFRLSSDPADESYTLLVKKVKDNLVAAVVSNNDKNRVNLDIGDEVYLFSGVSSEKWVTKTLLMQKQSYPLIILSVAEEPWPLTPDVKKEPPAPEHEIESTEEGVFLPFPTVGGETAVASVKEEKEDGEEEDLTSMAGITIRELRAEPGGSGEEGGVRLGAEDLDELPEIDTSELEAELDADIEDTLEKERGQFAPPWMEAGSAPEEPVAVDESHLPADDDELSGMVMARDERFELDAFEEEEQAALTAGKLEEPEEPEMLDMAIAEPLVGRETLEDEEGEEEVLYVPKESEAGEIMLETGEFHDFFTAYITPSGEAPGKAGQAAYVPVELEPVVESLTERIERLEKALAAISGEPVEPPRPRGQRKAVVLAGLSEGGFRAVMDEAPLSGDSFIVEIERPWRPPLALKAVAVAESSFEVNGITLAKFRFTSLDEKDASAVREYLDGREVFYRSLMELVKD